MLTTARPEALPRCRLPISVQVFQAVQAMRATGPPTHLTSGTSYQGSQYHSIRARCVHRYGECVRSCSRSPREVGPRPAPTYGLLRCHMLVLASSTCAQEPSRVAANLPQSVQYTATTEISSALTSVRILVTSYGKHKLYSGSTDETRCTGYATSRNAMRTPV